MPNNEKQPCPIKGCWLGKDHEGPHDRTRRAEPAMRDGYTCADATLGVDPDIVRAEQAYVVRFLCPDCNQASIVRGVGMRPYPDAKFVCLACGLIQTVPPGAIE